MNIPVTAMANALERDQTGRLAAIRSLRAWAMAPGGIGSHWISWYRNLVIAWIDHEKHPDHTVRLTLSEHDTGRGESDDGR